MASSILRQTGHTLWPLPSAATWAIAPPTISPMLPPTRNPPKNWFHSCEFPRPQPKRLPPNDPAHLPGGREEQ